MASLLALCNAVAVARSTYELSDPREVRMDSDKKPNEQEKKAYVRPELVVHGKIAELTMGTSGKLGDGPGSKRS